MSEEETTKSKVIEVDLTVLQAQRKTLTNELEIAKNRIAQAQNVIES